jgi:hypothetical protein
MPAATRDKSSMPFVNTLSLCMLNDSSIIRSGQMIT